MGQNIFKVGDILAYFNVYDERQIRKYFLVNGICEEVR